MPKNSTAHKGQTGCSLAFPRPPDGEPARYTIRSFTKQKKHVCSECRNRGSLERLLDRDLLVSERSFQNSELCRRLGVIPKYSYASCVATRPRGVRFRNPICMRNGS